ncbi:MAG: hypothetical protein ACE5SW_12930 [Nitrososphaeraceae archaeon]
MKSKKLSKDFNFNIPHYFHKGKVIIILGGILLLIGFIGAISMGSIVINEAVNYKLTSEGYPETEFLGISAYSYQYGSVFIDILGLFVLTAGLIGMDSKK